MAWIIDAGHAWLRVDLGEHPTARDYSTGFGYIQEPAFIYLEEDCEAVAFIESLGSPDWSAVANLPATEFEIAPCRSLPRSAAVFDVSNLFEVKA